MGILEVINEEAESDATKRLKSAEDMLNSKGYKLRTKGYGWVVIEPLGGRQRINSLEELERYAKSYP